MMEHVSSWKIIFVRSRNEYVLRYKKKGTWKQRSLKTTNKRRAESEARKLLTIADAGDIGWSEFRDLYDSDHLKHNRRPKTRQAFDTAANRLEQLCRFETVGQIDASTLVRFAAKLRAEGKSRETIAAYRAHIMSALSYAKRLGYIRDVPDPPPLPKGNSSRGRAITREEAERIAMAIKRMMKVKGDAWAWSLEFLWRSGFRIGETFALYWEPGPRRHYIRDINAKRPVIVIDKDFEKGKRDRVLPMTPDLVSLLRDVPPIDRRGRVVEWPNIKGGEASLKTVGKRISKAGESAGVITGQRDNGTPQFATAHDFRRAFCTRWSRRVMPHILQQLARHSDIRVTMRYYVDDDADAASAAIWSTEGDQTGDTFATAEPFAMLVEHQNSPK